MCIQTAKLREEDVVVVDGKINLKNTNGHIKIKKPHDNSSVRFLDIESIYLMTKTGICNSVNKFCATLPMIIFSILYAHVS